MNRQSKLAERLGVLLADGVTGSVYRQATGSTVVLRSGLESFAVEMINESAESFAAVEARAIAAARALGWCK